MDGWHRSTALHCGKASWRDRGQQDSDTEEELNVALEVRLSSTAVNAEAMAPLVAAPAFREAAPKNDVPATMSLQQMATRITELELQKQELERTNQEVVARNLELEQNVFDAAHFGQELLNQKVALENDVGRLKKELMAPPEELNPRKRATQLAAEFDKERMAYLEEKSQLLAKIKRLEEEKGDASVARISTLRKSLAGGITGDGANGEQGLDLQLELAEERARTAKLREALKASQSEQDNLMRKLQEQNSRPGKRLITLDKELVHLPGSDEHTLSWFGRLSEEVQTLREKLADKQEAELRFQACDAERLALKQRLENVMVAESAMQQRLQATHTSELSECRKVMEIEMHRTLLQIQNIDVGRMVR